MNWRRRRQRFGEENSVDIQYLPKSLHGSAIYRQQSYWKKASATIFCRTDLLTFCLEDYWSAYDKLWYVILVCHLGQVILCFQHEISS